MSDQTIDQYDRVLKDLNVKIARLGRTIDELDILAHQYQRLSLSYKELGARIDHMDALVFAVRQDFEKVRETIGKISVQNFVNLSKPNPIV